MMRTSLAILGLFASSAAYAQPEAAPQPLTTTQVLPPEPAAAPSKHHRVTIMWAPIRLVVPLVELTAEYAATDKLGVSLTLGGGKRTIESASTMEEVSGTELEGGAQVRYYLLGNFSHGMELGAELLYEHVAFEEPLPPTIAAVAAGGLTIGPFVGYKIATNLGFTFEAQLGARYVAVEPPVTGMAGSYIFDEKWLPLLHLNIGWSF